MSLPVVVGLVLSSYRSLGAHNFDAVVKRHFQGFIAVEFVLPLLQIVLCLHVFHPEESVYTWHRIPCLALPNAFHRLSRTFVIVTLR